MDMCCPYYMYGILHIPVGPEFALDVLVPEKSHLLGQFLSMGSK
jgi:hypothetical protein